MNTLDEFFDEVRLADADPEFFRYKWELIGFVRRCCQSFEQPDKIVLILTDYFGNYPFNSRSKNSS